MKFLTIAVVFSFSTSLLAQAPATNDMFAQAKEHALSNIDKRIGYLNEMKSCVQAATDKNGIHACRQKHKEEVKALKDGNQSWKQGMKSQRDAKRAAKKQQ